MAVGYGALGCNSCDGVSGGLTGGVSLEAALNPRLFVGVGTMGWTKSDAGTKLTVATLAGVARFYPSETGRFFITGGLGAGSIGADVSGFGNAGEGGVAFIVGAGMDLRLTNNLSLTPFWNGVAIRTANSDASVGQLGVGLSVH
jgi:hypothetical protein